MTDDRLTRFLDHVRLDRHLKADEVSDALWLATHFTPRDSSGPESPWQTQAVEAPGNPTNPDPDPIRPRIPFVQPDESDPDIDSTPVPLHQAASRSAAGALGGNDATLISGTPVNALPGALDLARALRPLKARRPVSRRPDLDEPATAHALAEAQQAVSAARLATTGAIVMRPRTERWLDLELIVDTGETMEVWHPTITQLRLLLERHGAFRDVKTWWLDSDNARTIRFRGRPRGDAGQPLRAGERRLVLFVTDGLGTHWHDRSLVETLRVWQRTGPVAVLQVLPQRMWDRTWLATRPVEMRAAAAGSTRLIVRPREPWASTLAGQATGWVPVMELDAEWIGPWARALRGHQAGWFPGMAMDLAAWGVDHRSRPALDQADARHLVRDFKFAASTQAFTLAAFLGAAPLTLPTMRFVQSAMLPASSPSHLAEVYLSGLLVKVTGDTDPDAVLYEFRDGVREQMLSSLTRREAYDVLERLGRAPRQVAGSLGSLDFRALVPDSEGTAVIPAESRAFAHVAATVLGGLGGRYRQIADQLTAGSSVARSEYEPESAPPTSELAGRTGQLHEIRHQRFLARLIEEQKDQLVRTRMMLDSPPGPVAIEVEASSAVPSGVLRLNSGTGVTTVSVSDHLLDVMDAVVESHTSTPALELISALVAHRNDSSHEASWVPHVISGGVPDLHQVLDRVSVGYTPLRWQAQVWEELVAGGVVRVEGRSGSGKTTAVRAVAAQWLTDREPGGLVWLDLIDPNDGDESVVLTLLTMPRRSRYLVVMDNIQANLTMARRVLALVARLRDELSMHVSVLATGWLENAAQHINLPGQITVVHTEAPYVLAQLIGDLRADSGLAEGIRQLADGDLVLAVYALEFFKQEHRLPGQEEFIDWIADRLSLDRVTDPPLRRTLYELSCLTMFEIDIPPVHVRAVLSREDTDKLLTLRLIESTDTSYQVQSRSVAGVIARYALTHWENPAYPFPPPSEVALNFLIYAGDRQINAALERLDLINIARDTSVSGSRFLITAMHQRRQISERLIEQVHRDPGWEDNSAAAAFACMALAQLDRPDTWERSAEAVRQRWSYDPAGDLPSLRGEIVTAEFSDFERIRNAMEEADRRGDGSVWPAHLTGEQLDLDRMHRTAMLGILLGFEGTALSRDYERIEQLYHSAERAQEIDGSFYPKRVPWVTARVLIGLCEAGCGDSQVARHAAEWLRETGRTNMGWKSGTGGWNTDYMTTATCIVALRTFDTPADDLAVQAGYALLQTLPITSAETSSQIEHALCAQALLMGDQAYWPSAYEQLLVLLGRASNPRTWRPKEQSEAVRSNPNPFAAKTTVPFTASILINCVLQVIKNELSTIFVDLERPTVHGTDHTPAVPSTSVAALAGDPDSDQVWHTVVSTSTTESVHPKVRTSDPATAATVDSATVRNTAEIGALALPEAGPAHLFAVGASDGSVQLRRLSDALVEQSINTGTHRVVSLKFGPGARVAIGLASGTVLMWDWSTATELWRVDAHGGWVWALTFIGAGDTLVTGGGDGAVRMWDSATGARRGTISASSEEARALASLSSPDGDLLAVGGGRRVQVRRLPGQEVIHTLPDLRSAVRSVALGTLNGEPTLAVGDASGNVHTTAIDRAGSVRTFTGRTGAVRAVAIGELAGRSALSSSADDNAIQFWDLATGTSANIWQAENRQWISAADFVFFDGRLRRALAVGGSIEIAEARWPTVPVESSRSAGPE
jgi:hypothetical protein